MNLGSGDPPLATGRQNDDQSNIDLTAQKPKRRRGDSPSTRGTTKTEPEAKECSMIRFNASGLSRIAGLMEPAMTTMRATLSKSLLG